MNNRLIEAIYPASPQQQGMLFETLFAPGSGIYIEQEIYPLPGTLDPNAFGAAWQRIIKRHDVLRTAFVWKDQDEPLQVVLRDAEIPLERQDWRALLPVEQRRRLEEYLQDSSRKGFDLSKAPLMRLALFQITDSLYQFVWTHHHILMDGWCRPILFKEFETLYNALSNGRPFQLEPSRSYREYITWLGRQDFAAAEKFWRNTLQDFSEPTPLGLQSKPGGEVRPERRYGRTDGQLGVAATGALRSLAQEQRLTLNTLVQGIYSLLLKRYSGQDEVVFGTTVSGRPPELAGVESMIGLFINTLPFRARVPAEGDLWSWLQDLQTAHLNMREFEFCSTGQIHNWIQRDGWQPIYDSVLVYENYPMQPAPEQMPLTGDNAPVAHGIGAHTNYALTILIVVTDRLALHLVYDKRRLEQPDVSNIRDHILMLLQSISEESNRSIETLLDMVPAEQTPTYYSLPEAWIRPESEEYIEPRTVVEETLAEIWADVLGVERVGMNSSFFNLGGHSLLAMQLISRIRESFDIDFPLRHLFDAPTIEDQALLIEEILLSEIESMSDEETQRSTA